MYRKNVCETKLQTSLLTSQLTIKSCHTEGGKTNIEIS